MFGPALAGFCKFINPFRMSSKGGSFAGVARNGEFLLFPDCDISGKRAP